MNQLTTTPPFVELTRDNYCRHCGGLLLTQDNYCGACGTLCPELLGNVHAESIPVGQLSIQSTSMVANNPSLQTIRAVLNNRLAVIAIIAFIGPPGLLALWFSPRFAKHTKIISTAFYLLGTVVLPLAIGWYLLDYSLRPLVEVFGK
jgi:hypothetical protein